MRVRHDMLLLEPFPAAFVARAQNTSRGLSVDLTPPPALRHVADPQELADRIEARTMLSASVNANGDVVVHPRRVRGVAMVPSGEDCEPRHPATTQSRAALPRARWKLERRRAVAAPPASPSRGLWRDACALTPVALP